MIVLNPAAINEDALDQVMAFLDAEPELKASVIEPKLQRPRVSTQDASTSSGSTSRVPQPLAEYIGHSLDEVDWKRIVSWGLLPRSSL